MAEEQKKEKKEAGFWDSKFGNILGKTLTEIGLAEQVSDEAFSISDANEAILAQQGRTPKLPKKEEQPFICLQNQTQPEPSAGLALEEKIKISFERYLADILKAAPEKFQQFTEQKEQLMISLGEELSGEKLERSANKAALRITKLTCLDVEGMVSECNKKIEDLKSEFVVWQKSTKERLVDKPNQDIQQTLAQIEGLKKKIAGLESEIRELNSAIEPARKSISEAETDLKEAEEIFTRSIALADNAKHGIAQQLFNYLETKEVKK